MHMYGVCGSSFSPFLHTLLYSIQFSDHMYTQIIFSAAEHVSILHPCRYSLLELVLLWYSCALSSEVSQGDIPRGRTPCRESLQVLSQILPDAFKVGVLNSNSVPFVPHFHQLLVFADLIVTSLVTAIGQLLCKKRVMRLSLHWCFHFSQMSLKAHCSFGECSASNNSSVSRVSHCYAFVLAGKDWPHQKFSWGSSHFRVTQWVPESSWAEGF